MNIKELLLRSDEIVKQLTEGINNSRTSLKEAEEKILEYVNRIGQAMTDQVIETINEPVMENRVLVDGEEAVFDGMRNIRFINRFGAVTTRLRRCYKYVNKEGGYYPLDEKLGIDLCAGFSPLMSYLQSLFGATESFDRSEELLSGSIGFKVSATAIQGNTEKLGMRIDDMPYRMISDEKRKEACKLMIIEIDGTMSPQIHEEEGITGREGLKQPTEYKECNLVVIDKYVGEEKIDRWIGARYGPRKEFEEHVRRTGLQMGQLAAEQVAFVADGASTLYHKFCHQFWQFIFFSRHANLGCGIWLTRLYSI